MLLLIIHFFYITKFHPYIVDNSHFKNFYLVNKNIGNSVSALSFKEK